MPYYTNVANVIGTVPQVGSVTTVVSADIVRFIDAAESQMHGILAKAYTVPISPVPPLLETIATDMTLYRLLGLRFLTQDKLKDSIWPARFKESMQMLKDIAAGNLALVNSAGTLIAADVGDDEFASSTLNYQQTFTEDGMERAVVDPDKIDELRADRI